MGFLIGWYVNPTQPAALWRFQGLFTFLFWQVFREYFHSMNDRKVIFRKCLSFMTQRNIFGKSFENYRDTTLALPKQIPVYVPRVYVNYNTLSWETILLQRWICLNAAHLIHSTETKGRTAISCYIVTSTSKWGQK